MCRLRAAAVRIGIKAQVDGAPAIAQCTELLGIEMASHRAGDIVKTRLPQHGIVKQSFDENHFGKPLDLLPRIHAAFGTGQETMRRRSRDAASVEITLQWKDNPA